MAPHLQPTMAAFADEAAVEATASEPEDAAISTTSAATEDETTVSNQRSRSLRRCHLQTTRAAMAVDLHVQTPAIDRSTVAMALQSRTTAAHRAATISTREAVLQEAVAEEVAKAVCRATMRRFRLHSVLLDR